MQTAFFRKKVPASSVRCERFRWRDKQPGRRKAYQAEGWLVDWRDSEGQRHRRKFEDERAAKLFVSQKQVETINGARAYRNVSTRLTDEQLAEAEAAFTRLGSRYCLSEALDYFFSHYQLADFQISLADASAQFRKAMVGQVRKRTLVQLQSTLSAFERSVALRSPTPELPLHEITSHEVEGFLKALRAKDGANPASPKTWNNARADLHRFFAWCAERPRSWISANPAADAPRYRLNDRDHVEVLPAEQARELMAFVSDYKGGQLARYFALALFAGIRPGGELQKLGLSPESVDLENNVIRLSAAMSKTRKPRQVVIQSNLRAWLLAYPGAIIPRNADRDLKMIRKRFGLSHDECRHTFVSMHVAAFKSFAETAVEAGNSEQIIRAHYFNRVGAQEADAFWTILPGGQVGEAK